MSIDTATEELRWDLTAWFDEFDGPAYRRYVAEYEADLQAGATAWSALGPLQDTNVDAWVQQLLKLEALTVKGSHLGAYLGCLSAADTTSEPYADAYAQLSVWRSRQHKLFVQAVAGLRGAPPALFERLQQDGRLAGCEYHLQRMRQEADWSMPEELELLTADLSVDGFSAWGRLYDQVSGKLEFDMPNPDGSIRKVPMAQRISLMEHHDPTVRRDTLLNSNQAWAGVEDVMAAALNSIAGTRLTLDKRRGVPHFLDAALFEAGISARTLDTMMAVVAENRDLPQRYLRIKAKMLGLPQLGLQDTSCAVPVADDETLTWDTARQRVLGAFGQSYPALADFARMALERRWVEAEARPGKRPGGFCTSSYLARESRVFMTFTGTSGEAQTLAHELGHAYHNWVMRDLRAWGRSYPMTLAESASTFGETLVTDALLSDPAASLAIKAGLLNIRLVDAVAYLLNIPMRFMFEKAFYEERAAGPVRVSRLKALMVEAQRTCFGDTLADDGMHPYFWASKLHFYITGVRFYNFPYVFGYLFSLGLFARFKAQGPAFFKQYETLLRLTGSCPAEEVARRALGVDLEAPDYWRESVALIEADLAEFERVVAVIG